MSLFDILTSRVSGGLLQTCNVMCVRYEGLALQMLELGRLTPILWGMVYRGGQIHSFYTSYNWDINMTSMNFVYGLIIT